MKILITPRAFANYGDKEVALMEKQGFTVEFNATGRQFTEKEFKEKSKLADAIIVGVDEVTADIIDNAPQLKVICKFGVGTDNIDVAYAQSKGIVVERILGANTNAVAEHVLALMFLDAKNLYPIVKEVKNGQWNKPTGIELKDKVLGIVGYGAIGKNIAHKAYQMGMKVLVTDVFTVESAVLAQTQAQQVELDILLESSDYISLHLPLTDQTKDLIDRTQFLRMKKTACLINTARGGIVNEEALLEALRSHQIKSACFDVFSTEPPEEGHPLLALDNFILSPHTAARTEDTERNSCRIATELILNTLTGGRKID